ncbi:MAG: LL-diaminopimelate aminotransferase [Intestinimonas sp.]|jgi:LL-diaminopimelate aminotransferase|nr:LL-diaminopimelate aminotransferase [Intestinimonas sp.]
MARINDNFQKLPGNYLFSEIARRVAAYRTENPDRELILLGIGDVTRPLPAAVVAAMHRAADEMGQVSTFRGYGPEQGYDFLRETIAQHDFAARGIKIRADEIFISDGAKSDCGNIVDIFAQDNRVAVCDPVYPVYVDTNVMSGRAGEYDPATGKWSNLCYMPCTRENHFIPEVLQKPVDLVYLCFPNNPTGAVATREQLAAWVNYANACGAIILFDAAYEAYITDPAIPHSIYEIPGAETCAIEFRSFSKTAGFTGARCAYTMIPEALVRDGAHLRDLWNRRQCTKFNGVPYVTQMGAAAVYSPEGAQQVRENLDYYRKNAVCIRNGLLAAGLAAFGGENSPYIWVRTPDGMPSWDFFDLLLKQANVVTTPGAGFGPSGEGYIRLTAFGDAEKTAQAVERIRSIL